MELQQFVTEVIHELGGFVEPLEYAFCHVLIPDGYSSYFQNKSEVHLAFDYEVAQENPDAEFVTFGSYFLEQLLVIVQEKALSALRFVEVERLEVGNPLKKITDFLANEQRRIQIIEEKPVMGTWAVFHYQLTYITDEKTDTWNQVWVNLLTNQVDEIMKENQNRMTYQQESLYHYAIPDDINLAKAMNVALTYVKDIAERHHQQNQNNSAFENDFTRINYYYSELLQENEKRANRSNITDEKRADIKAKSIAINAEKEKQLQEIHNKYNGQTEINLDNGILYFVPLQAYTIQINLRGNTIQQILYHNPITKQFFTEVDDTL